MTKPEPFHGFIGQRKIVGTLRKYVDGSKKSGRPIPHFFLIGASGLGKTELAKSVATAMDKKCHQFVAKKELEINQILDGLRSYDIVFIDEAHNLSVKCQEDLFPLLDQPAQNASSGSSLPLCTVVLATDQPGGLLNAMQRRIPQSFVLQSYSNEELIDVIARMASDQNLLITPQARRLLAECSQGIPRLARHLIQSLQTFHGLENNSSIDTPQVASFLEQHGYDSHSRTDFQSQYLNFLKNSGIPTSVLTLATQLGVDVDYLERQVEPFLIRQGWITKSSCGRELTASGIKSLSHQNPSVSEK